MSDPQTIRELQQQIIDVCDDPLLSYDMVRIKASRLAVAALDLLDNAKFVWDGPGARIPHRLMPDPGHPPHPDPAPRGDAECSDPTHRYCNCEVRRG